jgi:hypothetical protein
MATTTTAAPTRTFVLDDYTGYTLIAAQVALQSTVLAYNYNELAAIIVVRGSVDYFNPATQYNLGTVWDPALISTFEKPGATTGVVVKPTEHWS